MRTKPIPLLAYRKDNRKRNLRRLARRLFLAAAIVFLLCSAAAVYRWRAPLTRAAASARSFILENPYFAVQEIQVRGGGKVGGREIIAMAGLKQGMNMWAIEPSEIEKEIVKHPWVRRVLVRREFPRRVVIEVEERTPKAIVAMGKLYYADSNGTIFAEVGEGEKVKLPLLTGLRAEELVTTDPLIRHRIEAAVRLGELMTKKEHTLSEIHFASPDRLVLYTTQYPVALHMGWGDWDGKLQRLDRVLSLWKGNEARLASLDMSFRDQVVAHLKRAER